ncbi:hypothetical protein HDV03_001452 [Kappamyces sp. JEL0829]|nr:hypothetical protein HDV03_001452 [Kappamyces sp. JEL0829]
MHLGRDGGSGSEAVSLPQSTHAQQPSLERLVEFNRGFDRLAMPLGAKTAKRATSVLAASKARNQWEIQDYELYAQVMVGRLGIDDCRSVVHELESRAISISLELCESLLQSICIKNNARIASAFMENVQARHDHLFPTAKIVLAMAVGALEENDLAIYSQWFTVLRRTWWPLTRTVYTHLIGAHLDFMIRCQQSREAGPSSTGPRQFTTRYQSDPLQEAYSSLQWVLKHMHLTGMRMNCEQTRMLIIGLAQSGMLEKAFSRYHLFVQQGFVPDVFLVDSLTIATLHQPPHTVLRLGWLLNKRAALLDIVRWLRDEYTRHSLEPSESTIRICIDLFRRTRPGAKIAYLSILLIPQGYFL